MSATAASPPREITPEEFERMPDAHRWELIDGQLVERNLSSYTSGVALRLNTRVVTVAEMAGGTAGQSDCGLRIFPHTPRRVVFPDGCYFSRERLPHGFPPEGWVKVAPDLVIEVVSPGDIAGDVQTKVLDYLNAGVRLVWVVYPPARAVAVHRADFTGLTLIGDAVLTGEDILPGFAVPISTLFPPVDEATDTGDEDAQVITAPEPQP